VKRIVVASIALALAGAIAPWNGPAGADVVFDQEHKLDVMIKLKGGSWVGANAYSQPHQQHVTGTLRRGPGRVVAYVRIVNRGTAPTDVDIWTSSIRGDFYGGTARTRRSGLAPGDVVRFRYVAHRGTARSGDRGSVDITVRHHNTRHIYDGVQLVLRAVGRG
jgi:hypothetical protein